MLNLNNSFSPNMYLFTEDIAISFTGASYLVLQSRISEWLMLFIIRRI